MLIQGTRPTVASGPRTFGKRSLYLALLVTLASLLLVMPERADALNLARLTAPGSVCKGQSNNTAPANVQVRAMRCLINYARKRSGLRPLKRSRQLDRSSKRKSVDMLRCGSFDHYACGRDFTFWMHKVGYTSRCWAGAENIAWGQYRLGNPRQIFRAWMRSSGHRKNILSRNYRALGVGLRKGRFQGHKGAQLWTTHFGKRC